MPAIHCGADTRTAVMIYRSSTSIPSTDSHVIIIFFLSFSAVGLLVAGTSALLVWLLKAQTVLLVIRIGWLTRGLRVDFLSTD